MTRSNTTVVAVAASVAAAALVAVMLWMPKKRDDGSSDTAVATNSGPQQIQSVIQARRSIFPKHYDSNASSRVSDEILAEMLEAARWAPSHHLTEPWHFIVFSSATKRRQLGELLATNYQQSCSSANKEFSEKKFKKKIQNCVRASYVIAICCSFNGRNPPIEEVCSVAAAVQNMHLVATSYHVGAYWSTSGIYGSEKGNKSTLELENPPALRAFLDLSEKDFCLGWMFVGALSSEYMWPEGRRKPCRVKEL